MYQKHDPFPLVPKLLLLVPSMSPVLSVDINEILYLNYFINFRCLRELSGMFRFKMNSESLDISRYLVALLEWGISCLSTQRNV
jgi:hypothetical protein